MLERPVEKQQLILIRNGEQASFSSPQTHRGTVIRNSVCSRLSKLGISPPLQCTSITVSTSLRAAAELGLLCVCVCVLVVQEVAQRYNVQSKQVYRPRERKLLSMSLR